MPKKVKRKVSEKELATMVTDSANQIWLAGLAAFDKAQKEGSKVFDTLVKEGEKVENKTRKIAGKRFDEVKAKASGTWDKLEHVFEDRVDQALGSLGVPSKSDVANLSDRVAELTKTVAALKPAKRAPAAKKTTAAKRPATVKKVATPRKTAAKAPSKRAAKPTSAAATPDNLTVITGVGPVLARKLAAEGIVSYKQIAAWKSKDITAIEPKLMRIAGRISRDDWVGQARKAHREKYGKNP